MLRAKVGNGGNVGDTGVLRQIAVTIFLHFEYVGDMGNAKSARHTLFFSYFCNCGKCERCEGFKLIGVFSLSIFGNVGDA